MRYNFFSIATCKVITLSLFSVSFSKVIARQLLQERKLLPFLALKDDSDKFSFTFLYRLKEQKRAITFDITSFGRAITIQKAILQKPTMINVQNRKKNGDQ